MNSTKKKDSYPKIADQSVLVYFGVNTLFTIGMLISSRVHELNMLPNESNYLSGLVFLIPIFFLFIGIPVFISWIVARVSKNSVVVFAATLLSVLFHLPYTGFIAFWIWEFVRHGIDPASVRPDEWVDNFTLAVVLACQVAWLFFGVKRTRALRQNR